MEGLSARENGGRALTRKVGGGLALRSRKERVALLSFRVGESHGRERKLIDAPVHHRVRVRASIRGDRAGQFLPPQKSHRHPNLLRRIL